MSFTEITEGPYVTFDLMCVCICSVDLIPSVWDTFTFDLVRDCVEVKTLQLPLLVGFCMTSPA